MHPNNYFHHRLVGKRSGSPAYAVADPGFLTGGVANSRGGYVSKILYVETKESEPLGRSISLVHKCLHNKRTTLLAKIDTVYQTN